MMRGNCRNSTFGEGGQGIFLSSREQDGQLPDEKSERLFSEADFVSVLIHVIALHD